MVQRRHGSKSADGTQEKAVGESETERTSNEAMKDGTGKVGRLLEYLILHTVKSCALTREG